MWILKFLPDWFFYAVLFLGIAGLLATYLLKYIPIPVLYLYRTAIQIAAVVIIFASTFMIGAQWNEDAWKEKVLQLEKEVSEAKAKSNEVTIETVTQYVDRTKIIKEKGEDIIKYVDKEVIKFNNVCKLPTEVINVHNKAATGELK